MKQAKETGALFNGDMVRAIMDGSKTNTRRLMRPNTIKLLGYAAQIGEVSDFINNEELHENDPAYIMEFSPCGGVGDLLYVRENWSCLVDGQRVMVHYPATYGYWKGIELKGLSDEQKAQAHKFSKKNGSVPSLLMPKWAARTWLEITGVKVQRLQDISEDDAISEGVQGIDIATGGDDCQDFWRDYMAPKGDEFPWHKSARESFKSLWVLIYGQQSWDANPWAFAYSFKLIKK